MLVQLGAAMGAVQVAEPEPGAALPARLDIRQRIYHYLDLLFGSHVSLHPNTRATRPF
jgi:hypothetical protein